MDFTLNYFKYKNPANRKAALRAYLEWTAAGRGSLGADQFAAISPVAHQCPRTGGNAVYMARALYQLKEHKYFDDRLLCAEVDERGGASAPPSQAPALLWPNPGRDRLNLWLPNLPSETVVRLRITDPSGKLLRDLEAPALRGNVALTLEGLLPGMYFCQALADERPLCTLKFVVSQ